MTFIWIYVTFPIHMCTYIYGALTYRFMSWPLLKLLDCSLQTKLKCMGCQQKSGPLAHIRSNVFVTLAVLIYGTLADDSYVYGRSKKE